MVIIKYLGIRNKYHQGFRRNSRKIKQIVIHGTGGGGSARGILSWMEDGERAKEYKKGIALFNYLIDYNGDIYEIIDPDRWIYHSSSGKHDKETIGIELLNKTMYNAGGYTKEQYDSLINLCVYLMGIYQEVNQIIGHGKVKRIFSKKYKDCPGPNFDWNAICQGLTTEGYAYKICKEHIKDIEKEYYV